MSDRNHAQLMMQMARKDLSALENMGNAETFADEIFGFHAQQAVEKALKGWLSFLGISYPRIHDLEELLALITDHDQDTEAYGSLIDLNDFAVQYRYDAFDDVRGLDRQDTTQRVRELIVSVERLLDSAD